MDDSDAQKVAIVSEYGEVVDTWLLDGLEMMEDHVNSFSALVVLGLIDEMKIGKLRIRFNDRGPTGTKG